MSVEGSFYENADNFVKRDLIIAYVFMDIEIGELLDSDVMNNLRNIH